MRMIFSFKCIYYLLWIQACSGVLLYIKVGIPVLCEILDIQYHLAWYQIWIFYVLFNASVYDYDFDDVVFVTNASLS